MSQSAQRSSLHLQMEKGVYCLVGDQVEALARRYAESVPESAWRAQEARDHSHHHITIFTPAEMATIPAQELALTEVTQSISLFELGLAHVQKGNLQSWYVVIYCPEVQRIRAKYNLSEKQLHITVGFVEQDLYGELQSDLFQNISIPTNLHSLVSCVNYITSNIFPVYRKASKSDNLQSSLSFRQEIFIVSKVIYQLMELESWPINQESFCTVTPFQFLKDFTKSFFQFYFQSSNQDIKQSYSQLIEDLGWFLFPKGNFLGLKILLFLQLEKKKMIQFNSFEGYFPLMIPRENIQNIHQFIDNIIELNRIIISYGQMNKKNHQSTEKVEEFSFKKNIFLLKKKEKNYYLDFVALPRNFSFIPLIDTQSVDANHRLLKNAKEYSQMIAGSAYPSSIESLLALFFVGIRHIFTIHEDVFTEALQNEVNKILNDLYTPFFAVPAEKKPSNKAPATVVAPVTKDSPAMAFHFYQVNDRTPPTRDQLKESTQQIHKFIYHEKQSVLVHCQGGVGRTNTVILAYLMIFQNVSFADGYNQILNNRKVILSLSQQELLKKWYQLMFDDEILLKIRSEILGDDSTSSQNHHQEEENSSYHQEPVKGPSSKPQSIIRTLPPSSLDYQAIARNLNMPPVIMFVGIPASAKSTFSKAMVQSFPNYFIRINRDEMRGKGECETLLQQSLELFLKQQRQHSGAMKTKNGNSGGVYSGPVPQRVILLDNCHLTKEKRKEWMMAAHQVPMWCVYFNRPVEMCKERIMAREDHPTIQSGNAGVRIIDSMVKQFEPPTLKEGFEQIFTIETDEDMENLLQLWKIPSPIIKSEKNEEEGNYAVYYEEGEDAEKETPDLPVFNAEKSASLSSSSSKGPNLLTKPLKFPKIPHLVNLGAATRDDKILSSNETKLWFDNSYTFLIEEKIDGANIGVWIYADEDGYEINPITKEKQKKYCNYQIMIQNRSHYINQHYHKQFEKIHLWLEKHKYELYNLLIPNETILYGEWVYAKHSISYNQLPEYFIAYDLYSISKQAFHAKSQFLSEMNEHASTITLVPILYEGNKLSSLQQIIDFVNGPSMFSTTDNREGIVVRVHKKDELIMKCKVVREHFIAGNDRWNKSDHMALNSLAKKY